MNDSNNKSFVFEIVGEFYQSSSVKHSDLIALNGFVVGFCCCNIIHV